MLVAFGYLATYYVFFYECTDLPDMDNFSSAFANLLFEGFFSTLFTISYSGHILVYGHTPT